MNYITLLPQKIGQRLNGVEKTPSIIKKELNKYKNLKFFDLDFKNSYSSNNSLNFLNIIEDCKKIFYYNGVAISDKDLNINIGGDHSISLGTITSSIEKYQEDLIVFWIDAHADINSYENSLTKNIHGMPLYYLTHCDNYLYESWICDNQLDFKNLFYFGIRDLDNAEIKTLNEKNIWNFNTFRYQNEKNIDINLESHFQLIKEIIKGKKIHLSIDVDGIDPNYIPSTGTPVIDGLSLDYVLKLIETIKLNLVNVDIVELNLDLGDESEQKKSIKNTMKILDSLIK